MISALQDVQVGLGLTGAAEQRLQEDLILALTINRFYNHLSFCFSLQQGFEILKCFEVCSCCVIFFTDNWLVGLVALQNLRTDELVVE